MKIAVIKTGGKQYKIKEGQTLKIEKIAGSPRFGGEAGEEGKDVKFDQVLLIADEKGEKVEIGQPLLDKKVEAEILEQGRDKKVTVVKYKRKTRYRRKKGHRQAFTKIKITKIGGTAVKKPVVKKSAVKKTAVKKIATKK